MLLAAENSLHGTKKLLRQEHYVIKQFTLENVLKAVRKKSTHATQNVLKIYS